MSFAEAAEFSRFVSSIIMQSLCLITSILSLVRLIYSIEVTPNSKCFSLCADDVGHLSNIADTTDSWTHGTSLVCEDGQLAGPNSTVKGRKWKECLNCELASTAVDSPSNERDLYWFLFNTKFSFNWCVFAYPDNTNLTDAGRACAETCQGPDNHAKAALVDRRLREMLGKGAELESLGKLYVHHSDRVPDPQLADTDIRWDKTDVKALNVACSQKPALGETLKLDFNLFPDASTQSQTGGYAITMNPDLSTQPPTTSPTKSGVVVTITANPVYPTPSAVSVISAFVASQSSAAATAAAQAKAKSDRYRNIGLGVGLTAGAVVVILAIFGIISSRRVTKRNRLIAEEQVRAHWEADYQALQSDQQHGESGHRRQPEELDSSYNKNAYPYEADDGRPRVELSSRST